MTEFCKNGCGWTVHFSITSSADRSADLFYMYIVKMIRCLLTHNSIEALGGFVDCFREETLVYAQS